MISLTTNNSDFKMKNFSLSNLALLLSYFHNTTLKMNDLDFIVWPFSQCTRSKSI